MAVDNFNYGYGPTEEEFTLYTGRTISNSAEFRRQRYLVQDAINTFFGPWAKFHEVISGKSDTNISLSTVTSTAITSPDLNDSRSGFYNNMEIRVVEGTGRGFRGYVGDYNGTTKVVSVSGISSVSLSSVSTSDTVVIKQIANFPREQDYDVNIRPRIPECLPRLVSYALEYAVNLESQSGWNSNELANAQPDVVQESIGNWQTTWKSDRQVIPQMIGAKAFELAIREGLIHRTGRLVKYPRRPY